MVLSIIEHGYIISLTQTPPPMYTQNNVSALREHDFVT